MLILFLCFFSNLQSHFLIRAKLNDSKKKEDIPSDALFLLFNDPSPTSDPDSTEKTSITNFLIIDVKQDSSKVNFFHNNTAKVKDIFTKFYGSFCKTLFTLPGTNKHLCLRKFSDDADIFYLEIHKYDDQDVKEAHLDEIYVPECQTNILIKFEIDYQDEVNVARKLTFRSITLKRYSFIIRKIINSLREMKPESTKKLFDLKSQSIFTFIWISLYSSQGPEWPLI